MGHAGRQTGRETHWQTYIVHTSYIQSNRNTHIQRGIHTYRQADTEAAREMGIQSDRHTQTNTYIQSQADRQTDKTGIIHTDRHTETHTS